MIFKKPFQILKRLFLLEDIVKLIYIKDLFVYLKRRFNKKEIPAFAGNVYE